MKLFGALIILFMPSILLADLLVAQQGDELVIAYEGRTICMPAKLVVSEISIKYPQVGEHTLLEDPGYIKIKYVEDRLFTQEPCFMAEGTSRAVQKFKVGGFYPALYPGEYKVEVNGEKDFINLK